MQLLNNNNNHSVGVFIFSSSVIVAFLWDATADELTKKKSQLLPIQGIRQCPQSHSIRPATHEPWAGLIKMLPCSQIYIIK